MVTAIIVGIITYGIVFNLDLISNKIKKAYLPQREKLIAAMQGEKGWWKGVGLRFEEFKPSSETKIPTEWWIPLYAVRRILPRWEILLRSKKAVNSASSLASEETQNDDGDSQRSWRHSSNPSLPIVSEATSSHSRSEDSSIQRSQTIWTRLRMPWRRRENALV